MIQHDEITPEKFEAAKALAQELTHTLGRGPFLEKSLAISLFLAAQLRGLTPDPEASRIGLDAIQTTTCEFLDEMWATRTRITSPGR